ncbi:MAG: hypothetical protein H0W12_04265 [Chitinophagaceae bacterium]|nr:hypothetical protein [Chitinophagaceae bacterium]
MRFDTFKNKIRYGSFLVPFRMRFIFLLIALLAGYRWLQKINSVPGSSYIAITELFIKVTLWFGSIIIILSFMSVVIPWSIFLLRKKNKAITIKLKTSNEKNTISQKQLVSIFISPIFKPLFGYVRLRLKYDGAHISQRFSIRDKSKKSEFLPTNIEGFINWPLPEIREYNIEESIIYFEDMFQFFSFVSIIPSAENFFTPPANTDTPLINVQPKKTEETNTRIHQLRKVEGEYINYKNFENNDDVRRIVWKIYAKSKELVIRMPETQDRYASHIYFYASFYNSFSSFLYEDLNIVLLNYYKTIVWNAYQQLAKRNMPVKFIPDQETKTAFADDVLQKNKYIISTSAWQTQKDIPEYLKLSDASVLCISSFSDTTQLQNSIGNAGKNIVVIFVKLSGAFDTIKIKDWIQWIFIKPEKDSLDKLRLTWDLSPLKRKLKLNEEKILALLSKTDCEKIIV